MNRGAALLPDDSPLYRALRRPRFTERAATVAVLDTGYHLQSECQAALRQLGHRPVRVAVDPQGPGAAALAQLLHALTLTRCDAVLAVNHLGLDGAGTTQSLLAHIGLPLASWFVDSPPFILGPEHHLGCENLSVFCWERAYLPLLAAAGAVKPQWLPLALDPATMAPPAQAVPERFPLAFVGDSMQHAEAKWRRRLDPGARRAAEPATRALLKRRDGLLPEVADAWRRGAARDLDVLAYATFRATARYRENLLRAVLRARLAPLHIFGDAGWQKVLPQARLHGPVRYGPALAAVYRATAVSLNATSLQMPAAVNQRAFDVPGCGGVVLSDAQADAETLMGAAARATTYRDADELVAQIAATRARPDAARAAATAQGEALRRGHTYADRLATVIAALRARHGAHDAAAASAETAGPAVPWATAPADAASRATQGANR